MSVKTVQSNLRPEDVEFLWVCPECGTQCLWSYQVLADDGTPVCWKCDGEMELDRTATAKIAKSDNQEVEREC